MLTSFKIPNNISVCDLVCLVYGTTDLSVKLMMDNPFITSINFDLTKFAGEIIFYNPSLTQVVPANLKFSTAPINPIKTYKVQQGQSIYDICNQVYGSVDQFSKLIDDNNLADKFDNPDSLAGLFLKYDSSITSNQAVSNSHKNKNVIYATSKTNIFVTLENSGSFDDSFDDSFDI